VPQLADLFLRLQAQGAHNINLVTAGHYWPWVREALLLAKPALHIPIVYNTGGYETPQALAALADCVDIYLTDIKYFSSALSAEYSDAADYFDTASRAAQIMCAQTGAPVLDKDGLLQRGVIVRHLALPGALQDSFAVLDFMATQLPKGGFLTSLMSQYTPAFRAAEHGALGRRISTYEYRTLVNRAIDLGLTQGYMQEKSSAKEEYTPPFNLQGLEHLAP
jgi:putative pyruvate formate lyase activating enzyme